MGIPQVSTNRKAGVSGDVGRPVRLMAQMYGQASSYSIVRGYMCTALFNPLRWNADMEVGAYVERKLEIEQRECGAFPPSLGARPALRPPGPHRSS